MRIVFTTLIVVLAAPLGYAQSIGLVPSNLVVPTQFQRFYDTVHTVNLPPGFTATVFYTGTLNAPRFMDFSPAGSLCVADEGLNAVIALIDSDLDGVVDTAITVATGTDNAHSIAFHDGGLFAASPNHVWRYGNPLSSGVYTTSQLFIDTIDSAPQGADNHTSRTLLFDDPSNSLYVSVGSPCDACRETDTTRGAIWRFNMDGTGRQTFATGLRNAVGLTMDSSHTLWATVAERNNQGEYVPGDLVTAVDSGRWYGWPLAFGDHQWDNFSIDSEYSAMLPITHADTAQVQNMRVPDATVDAHSTPLGIVYYDDTTLPPLYDKSFFVAVHGSSPGPDGRIVANGSKIVLVTKMNGVWNATDFCTGFLTDSINYIRWARPRGIIMDHKGNIYFSSDYSTTHAPAAIFRISYDVKNAVKSATNDSLSVDVSQNGDYIELRIENASGLNPFFFLYDDLGRKQPINLTPVEASPSERSYQVDIGSLKRGIYFLVIETAQGEVVRKLLH